TEGKRKAETEAEILKRVMSLLHVAAAAWVVSPPPAPSECCHRGLARSSLDHLVGAGEPRGAPRPDLIALGERGPGADVLVERHWPRPCTRKRNRNSNSFRESDRTESLRRRSQVRTCRLSMTMVLRAGLGKSSPERSQLSNVAVSVGSRPKA